MSEISRVNLRRVVPEANMFRQYSVTVSLDLFGEPLVTCAWGRIGARGQEQRHACETLAEAEALAERLVRQRLRRGYALLEQGRTRGAVRVSASPQPAHAAPRPSRRAPKNAAQLCLLTWHGSVNRVDATDKAPSTLGAKRRETELTTFAAARQTRLALDFFQIDGRGFADRFKGLRSHLLASPHALGASA